MEIREDKSYFTKKNLKVHEFNKEENDNFDLRFKNAVFFTGRVGSSYYFQPVLSYFIGSVETPVYLEIKENDLEDSLSEVYF